MSIDGNLDALQAAIAEAAAHSSEPAGVLKVSMSPTFGIMHILPLLPAFLARYPRIRPEWHFENRPVDLITENYDAAIGGGFNLAPGLVSRPLAPVHGIAVASPAYIHGLVPFAKWSDPLHAGAGLHIYIRPVCGTDVPGPNGFRPATPSYILGFVSPKTAQVLSPTVQPVCH
jgi:DNA-binding transcriptional LysR family regulator